MVKHLCSNGTMANTGNYSSPLPLIGLYIAAASLVCLILIICDVVTGLRRRKLWFPCRFFSLNSVTLTLMSVATKIPVDLTTQMPSAEDQLSKLSGTVFMCMCMGFSITSIGINKEFESYINITALSIFVVAMVVNICIQMATGVIFCFMVEHFIILFCMLLLIIRYWLFAAGINSYKRVYIDKNKDLIREGENSLLQRVKVCYLHGYNSCPQFRICNETYSASVPFVCTTCSVVLIEAMVRSVFSKDLKFCEGASDYGWSMWLIIATQVVTIVVVCLTLVCKWILIIRHSFEKYINKFSHLIPPSEYRQFVHLLALTSFPVSLERSFKYIVFYPLAIIDTLLSCLSIVTIVVVRGLLCCKDEVSDDRTMEEVKDLLEAHKVEFGEWVLKKCVKDMERWTEKNKKDYPKHLYKLLSKFPPPSPESLPIVLDRAVEFSSLSMLLLVNIAKLSTPTSLSLSLTNVLADVFEIVHFIDQTINSRSYRDRMRSIDAKILWKLWPINEGFNQKLVNKSRNAILQTHQFDSEVFLRELRRSFWFCSSLVDEEAKDIVDFFRRRSYASIGELYDHIEQQFVDMLHVFLARLPEAIFVHILESPMEEYEDRVRYGLGVICKLESLESYMGLWFPSGSNITSLSTVSDPVNEEEDKIQVIEG